VSAVDKSRRRPKAGGHERRRVPPPRCLRGLPTPPFVSPALAGSSFTYAEHLSRSICAGSGCLGALLRVPRPCGLLLYLRRTPRQPDPGDLVFENQVNTTQQQGGGACQSEMWKLVGQTFSSVPNSKRDVGCPEAEGRVTRTAACDPALLRSHPLRCLGTTQPEAECCREFRNSQ